MKFFESLVPRTQGYLWHKTYITGGNSEGFPDVKDRHYAVVRQEAAKKAEREKQRCLGHTWRFLATLIKGFAIGIVAVLAVLVLMVVFVLMGLVPALIRIAVFTGLCLYILTRIWKNTA